jgi:hypothetical protein
MRWPPRCPFEVKRVAESGGVKTPAERRGARRQRLRTWRWSVVRSMSAPEPALLARAMLAEARAAVGVRATFSGGPRMRGIEYAVHQDLRYDHRGSR